MYFAEIKAGNTIINEGDYGDTFYMLSRILFIIFNIF